MAKKTWSVEDFVAAWEKSNTFEEVAKALKADSTRGLGLTAAKYRRMGLPLKQIVTTTPQKKVEDLSGAIALLAKLRKQKVDEVTKEGKKVAADLEKKRQERKAAKDAT